MKWFINRLKQNHEEPGAIGLYLISREMNICDSEIILPDSFCKFSLFSEVFMSHFGFSSLPWFYTSCCENDFVKITEREAWISENQVFGGKQFFDDVIRVRGGEEKNLRLIFFSQEHLLQNDISDEKWLQNGFKKQRDIIPSWYLEEFLAKTLVILDVSPDSDLVHEPLSFNLESSQMNMPPESRPKKGTLKDKTAQRTRAISFRPELWQMTPVESPRREKVHPPENLDSATGITKRKPEYPVIERPKKSGFVLNVPRKSLAQTTLEVGKDSKT
jgi:hypothetical protein